MSNTSDSLLYPDVVPTYGEQEFYFIPLRFTVPNNLTTLQSKVLDDLLLQDDPINTEMGTASKDHCTVCHEKKGTGRNSHRCIGLKCTSYLLCDCPERHKDECKNNDKKCKRTWNATKGKIKDEQKRRKELSKKANEEERYRLLERVQLIRRSLGTNRTNGMNQARSLTSEVRFNDGARSFVVSSRTDPAAQPFLEAPAVTTASTVAGSTSGTTAHVAIPGAAPVAIPGAAPVAIPGAAPVAIPGAAPMPTPGLAPVAIAGAAPLAAVAHTLTTSGSGLASASPGSPSNIIVIDDDLPDVVREYRTQEELTMRINGERRVVIHHICGMMKAIKDFGEKHPELYAKLKRKREELEAPTDGAPPAKVPKIVDVTDALDYFIKCDCVLSPLNVNTHK